MCWSVCSIPGLKIAIKSKSWIPHVSFGKIEEMNGNLKTCARCDNIDYLSVFYLYPWVFFLSLIQTSFLLSIGRWRQSLVIESLLEKIFHTWFNFFSWNGKTFRFPSIFLCVFDQNLSRLLGTSQATCHWWKTECCHDNHSS